MPAITTCAKCGFTGNHGFTDHVLGILRYYHNGPNGEHCGFYSFGGKTYLTLAEAWVVARVIRPARDERDLLWLAAWDALLLENKTRKSKRLMKQWRELA